MATPSKARGVREPDKCACRWGEQPCDRCLPVLRERRPVGAAAKRDIEEHG